MTLFDHLLVPVANEDDAVATSDALLTYRDSLDRVTVVHVIEKAGGAVDKAPMEKRRADANAFLSTVAERLGDDASVETRIEFGTDPADTIVETAREVDATAIAFRPRGGSRLMRLLSGDTATRLVSSPELPVVALPGGDGD